MTNETILNEHFVASEHMPYNSLTVETDCTFSYKKYKAEEYAQYEQLKYNIIFFVVKGSCLVNCDQFSDRVFFTSDMFLLPKSSVHRISFIEDTELVYMTFDIPQNPHDRQYLEQLWDVYKSSTYDFAPLVMNHSTSELINSVVYYIKNDANSSYLYEIKQRELFMIFRVFYTREQFVMFFYPIIGKSFDFKNFILENYSACSRLDELIKLSNMCSNSFMRKFKKNFGMTAYQWMLNKMCQKIKYKASIPGVTVKDIMIEIGVDSPTHFNRICKRHFGKTPKELVLFYQNRQ